MPISSNECAAPLSLRLDKSPSGVVLDRILAGAGLAVLAFFARAPIILSVTGAALCLFLAWPRRSHAAIELRLWADGRGLLCRQGANDALVNWSGVVVGRWARLTLRVEGGVLANIHWFTPWTTDPASLRTLRQWVLAAAERT